MLLAVVWMVIMVTGLVLVRDHDQNVRERMERLEETERERAALQERRQALLEHLQALEGDPETVEEALRRKLRWTRPGEVVLRPVWMEDPPGMDEGQEVLFEPESGAGDGVRREKRLDISQVNP